MVKAVLGAEAELERSLIAEGVKAGLRNARAKGKTLGRKLDLQEKQKSISERTVRRGLVRQNLSEAE